MKLTISKLFNLTDVLVTRKTKKRLNEEEEEENKKKISKNKKILYLFINLI